MHHAVHFLDNVIEINKYPLPEIERMSKQTRKIGLGVMGFADMLIKLGTAYDSEAAVNQAEAVMGRIQAAARDASAALAMKRGNFPAYKGSRHELPETPHVRNATTTTIAPTGTISIIAGASSGIEPLFAVAHHRRVLEGKNLYEVHPLFIKMARELDFYDKNLVEQIAGSGSIQSVASVPDSVKKLFRTSHDIAPEWHIRIQAAFQKYTDNAVSKTVNLPADASETDVKEIYQAAYRHQCKGVTIYRYGSRKNQVLYKGSEDKMVLSCPDAICQVLKNVTNSDFVEGSLPMGGCPECGDGISHEEGCLICYSCGYTKCG